MATIMQGQHIKAWRKASTIREWHPDRKTGRHQQREPQTEGKMKCYLESGTESKEGVKSTWIETDKETNREEKRLSQGL